MKAADLLKQNRPPLICFYGPPGTGKGQTLDSIVWTPSGPTYMGDMRVGDVVLNASGSVSTVLGIYPLGIRDVYNVEFSDGSSVKCTDDHLWNVTYFSRSREIGRVGRKNGVRHEKHIVELTRVMSLKDIAKSYLYGDIKPKYWIPQTKPVAFTYRDCIVAPYTLGVILGDGHSCDYATTITTMDADIIDEARKELGGQYAITEREGKPNSLAGSFNIRMMHKELDKMGLRGLKSEAKFVPANYMFNIEPIRLAILQGLMDTAGWVDRASKSPCFCSTSRLLTLAVATIVESLGGICRITVKIPKIGDVEYRPAYMCTINIDSPSRLFRLKRKAELAKNHIRFKPRRLIKSVSLVSQEECQCIRLDSEDGLYLTDNFVVTHNTALVSQASGGYLFDFDAGMRTVLNIELNDKFAPLRKQIEFDEYKDEDATKPNKYLEAKSKLLTLASNNPYNAVVIDSLTGLCRAIRLHIMFCSGNSFANPQIQHWGQMVTELESVLSILRSLKVLTMVTAHTTDAEIAGQIFTMPLSVTEPHSKNKLTWLFNDVFFSKMALKAQGKIDFIMSNTISLGRTIKNQSCPTADYVVSDIGLVGLLDKMGYKYPPVTKQ